MNTTLAGKRGEALAAEYLRKKGYTLLEAGYRSRYGEIDLIVKKRGIVAMVEVKSRKSDRFAKALEAAGRPQAAKAAADRFAMAGGAGKAASDPL